MNAKHVDNAVFKKVNVRDVIERKYSKEGRLGFGKPISERLGRRPESTDMMERHPFDVEIIRVPPKSIPWRYHSHSAQWEFYYVMSGMGIVRHGDGRTTVTAGDAFLFKPGEAHQLINEGDDDFVMMVIADNPIGESYFYPDEAMWIVNSPERRYVVLHPERESQAPVVELHQIEQQNVNRLRTTRMQRCDGPGEGGHNQCTHRRCVALFPRHVTELQTEGERRRRGCR